MDRAIVFDAQGNVAASATYEKPPLPPRPSPLHVPIHSQHHEDASIGPVHSPVTNLGPSHSPTYLGPPKLGHSPTSILGPSLVKTTTIFSTNDLPQQRHSAELRAQQHANLGHSGGHGHNAGQPIYQRLSSSGNSMRDISSSQGDRYYTFTCNKLTGKAHTFSDRSGGVLYEFGSDPTGKSIWLTDSTGQRVVTGEVLRLKIKITVLAPNLRNVLYKRQPYLVKRLMGLDGVCYDYGKNGNSGKMWKHMKTGRPVMTVQNGVAHFYPNCPEIVEKVIALVSGYECMHKDLKKHRK